MKRPNAGGGDRRATVAPGDVLAGCPSIVELLTDDRWEDGEDRPLATLTVFVQDGVWKVCLSDKATERVIFCAGPSMEEAIRSMEEDLAEGTAQWRLAAGGKDRRPRKSS